MDTNLIAYEYYKNQFVPKEVYTSGKKDETSLIDKYNFTDKQMAILALDDDIINQDGYGLKKGFYTVAPDKHLDFLLIYQQGKLKAKIPVVKMEVFESNNAKSEKPKKMSQRAYQKKQEKEYRKFLKGENPSQIEWKTVQLNYSNEHSAYIITYDENNFQLIGIIKF